MPLLMVFLVTSLTACNANKPKAESVTYLNANEISELFSDGFMGKWKGPNFTADMAYNTDGTASADAGSKKLEGIWKLDGNTFCHKWNGESKLKCHKLSLNSPGVYNVFTPKGTDKGTFTVK